MFSFSNAQSDCGSKFTWASIVELQIFLKIMLLDVSQNNSAHERCYCYLQVKCVLVLHLVSAAFATAALGLMSKHLPYRQDSYHCEHCRRLEQHAVVLCLKYTKIISFYIYILLTEKAQNK